ncbi:MAG: protein-methionine-sulfoxide reductase catalytic subunit MsrP [Candidatus Aminicenantes bacterium]|nr:protein-methionine-sulfoxide reductase catalytic subunit MsrP [Candidatus Aminicenantes bacterium]
MLIKRVPDIKSSEITDKTLYMNRRQFIFRTATMAGVGLAVPQLLFSTANHPEKKLQVKVRGKYRLEEKMTSFKNAASYNNFYEFSTGKEDIDRLSQNFRTRPWTVSVEGHVKKPKTYDIDDLIKMFPLEERVYRFRCVEAWSMVVPWIGFPLGDLMKIVEPTSKAKYVEFTTLYDPEMMPGQRSRILDWPYVEGLRMDEASHPLTFMAVGMYDEVMPNQNGAPIRLVVPWKYGFKSIKSIVRIRFIEQMPTTSWVKAIPREYGFYANVNPKVDHPRWSQSRERRLGEFRKKKTKIFNGYAEQVAYLYAGMDLRKFY